MAAPAGAIAWVLIALAMEGGAPGNITCLVVGIDGRFGKTAGETAGQTAWTAGTRDAIL